VDVVDCGYAELAVYVLDGEGFYAADALRVYVAYACGDGVGLLCGGGLAGCEDFAVLVEDTCGCYLGR
jgi:hypothetical protein